MSAFNVPHRSLDELLQEILDDIDQRTIVLQIKGAAEYHSLRGLVDYYQQIVHTVLDSYTIDECSEKRRIYVKLEGLTKRHTIITFAEAYLTDVVSKGLQGVCLDSSPRFSGDKHHPSSTDQLIAIPSGSITIQIIENCIDLIMQQVDGKIHEAQSKIISELGELLQYASGQEMIMTDVIDTAALKESREKRSLFCKIAVLERKCLSIRMAREFFACMAAGP